MLRGQRLLDEWYEGGKDSIGPLYSCTKSILSALIGIAIDKGFITSVEQPITDYLDHPAEISDTLGQITIKHLLTMTPGFDWPDFDKPYKALKVAEEPIRFVLEQPLISEPGTAFAYNSGGSHLLSAILTKATGLSALSFAKDYLFGPLGFQSARWMERAGINEGGAGLYLYGRDLARIGSFLCKRDNSSRNSCYPPHGWSNRRSCIIADYCIMNRRFMGDMATIGGIRLRATTVNATVISLLAMAVNICSWHPDMSSSSLSGRK